MQAAVVLTGWYVGLAIAGVVIGIVVVLVSSILALARRIAEQAMAITQSLAEGRDYTQPLWDVARVNDTVREITTSAAKARAVLEEKL